MTERAVLMSPLLIDWLLSDGADVAAFVEVALSKAKQGLAACRGREEWPALDADVARAIRASFGLGLAASWRHPGGAIHLEHFNQDARLILPYRLPVSWEDAMIGRVFRDVVDLPFKITAPHLITAVYDMQGGLGLALCYEATPIAFHRSCEHN